MSLKLQAISGVKWTSASSITIAILQLTQLAILARYLESTDFGLMAIVTVVIGFSRLFMDMGISSAIIHRQDITNRQLSSLYWLNILAGVALAMLIFLLAPFIAAFYNEAILVNLIRLLSVTFILSAIGNQYRVLYQKELRFNSLAKIEVFSAFVSFISAVAYAMQGYGVYALVYATLIKIALANILYLISGIKKHKPALYFQYTDIKSMVGFGLFQMGERSINYFNSQFDTILIGKLLGTEALGVYSIAKELVMRPLQIINPVITRVTFPIMAKVQNDIGKLKNIYLKVIYYLCLINSPIYIAIAIFSEPIVLIIFGDNWHESILILSILACYFLVRTTGNPIGSLQLAKGRADLGFYWNLGLFVFIPFAIYLGSFWGLVGIATSLLILQLILVIPNWFFMVKPLCGAGFKIYFINILRPLFMATTAGAGAVIAFMLLPIENIIIKAVFALIIDFSLWVVLLISFDRDIYKMVLHHLSRLKTKIRSH